MLSYTNFYSVSKCQTIMKQSLAFIFSIKNERNFVENPSSALSQLKECSRFRGKVCGV